MQKLTFDQRKEHLESNQQLKKNREKFSEKSEVELFAVLNKHNYTFEKEFLYWDDGMLTNKGYYQDSKFRWAIVQVKLLKNKEFIRQPTIDMMITMIREMQALQKALDSSIPQSQPRNSDRYPIQDLESDADDWASRDTDSYSDRLREH